MKLLLFIFSSFMILCGLKAPRNTAPLAPISEEKVIIEDTFLSLDTVWIPGRKEHFPLHHYQNYLWIRSNEVSFLVDSNRGKSFRGAINDVSSSEVNGKRVTSFSVRNALMKVEITDLGANRFSVFVYNYLENYERIFSAFWVDPDKVQIDED